MDIFHRKRNNRNFVRLQAKFSIKQSLALSLSLSVCVRVQMNAKLFDILCVYVFAVVAKPIFTFDGIPNSNSNDVICAIDTYRIEEWA